MDLDVLLEERYNCTVLLSYINKQCGKPFAYFADILIDDSNFHTPPCSVITNVDFKHQLITLYVKINDFRKFMCLNQCVTRFDASHS